MKLSRIAGGFLIVLGILAAASALATTLVHQDVANLAGSSATSWSVA
jgi:hypothetical protein